MRPGSRSTAASALAVVMVTLPLTGLSFRGDERRNIYYNAERFGTNPLEPLSQAFSEVGIFLDMGNFRPVGRFLDYTQHAFVFEAAEATGVAPHVVQGIVRLGILALLALVLQRLVTRMMASSRVDDASWHLPLALAACLVAAGAENPILHFPFLFTSSTILILLVCQWVVRDQDLRAHECSRSQLIAVAVVGAVTASFFDMAYVTPALSLTYLAARSFAQNMSLASSAKSAAAKRLAALWIGFLAVFVPIRVVIAAECGDGRCYSGSDIQISSEVFELLADRAVTALPLSGWQFNSSAAETAGAVFGTKDAFANSFTALALLGLAVAGFLAYRGRPRETGGGTQSARPALAVMGFGFSVIFFSALLVSLSRLVQREQFEIGEGWRDTLLAQTGWALVICGTLGVLSQRIKLSTLRVDALRFVLSALLVVSASLTLIANERASLTDRRDDLARITIEISSSTTNFSISDEANAHRCFLLDRYTSFEPDPNAWIGGPQISQTLNALAISRYGKPFCQKSN